MVLKALAAQGMAAFSLSSQVLCSSLALTAFSLPLALSDLPYLGTPTPDTFPSHMPQALLVPSSPTSIVSKLDSLLFYADSPWQ